MRNRVPACAALVLVTLCVAVGLTDDKRPEDLDVPYEPTHPQVVDAMLDLAGVTDKDFVIDLGCGDGRIVLRAAKRHGARGLGVDLDPQRVREAREGAEHEGVLKLVEFREQDIMKTDIHEATAVMLYLLPSVNLMLRPKLFAELRPGTRIVSHAFDMDDWEADKTVEQARARARTIYLWVIPAPLGGTWRWECTVGGKTQPVTARLRQHFQKLSGAIAVDGQAPALLTDARIAGTDITLVAELSAEDKPVKVVYRGTVDGDVIRGTAEWLSGDKPEQRPWEARRAPADVTGTWAVTGPPQANGTLKIRRADGGLSATFTDAGGDERAVEALYAWGAAVRFEVAQSLQKLIFTGLLDDEGGGTVNGGILTRDQPWSARRGDTTTAPATRPAETRPTSQRIWTPDKGVPQPGDEFVTPRDGSVLVWIPGGDFTMGSAEGPEDEQPAHRVHVAGFWLGKYEVTNRQYAQFLEAQGGELPMFWEDRRFNLPDLPVVGVTWTEAADYCAWAGVRLPTEAEWEYAASGGRQLPAPTATGVLSSDLANLRGTGGKDIWELTAPVGRFPAGPFGLFDLAGNAWEWTTSRFSPYPYDSGDGREEPNGGLRVLRGGSWASPPAYARSQHRHRFSASLRYDFSGIRLAMSAGGPDGGRDGSSP